VSQQGVHTGDGALFRVRGRPFVYSQVLSAYFTRVSGFLRPFFRYGAYDDAGSSTLYFIASRVFGGKKEPLSILVKYLQKYMKDRETLVEKPVRSVLSCLSAQ
jgi:hypothetical protein